jgi:hypothetical protein
LLGSAWLITALVPKWFGGIQQVGDPRGETVRESGIRAGLSESEAAFDLRCRTQASAMRRKYVVNFDLINSLLFARGITHSPRPSAGNLDVQTRSPLAELKGNKIRATFVDTTKVGERAPELCRPQSGHRKALEGGPHYGT